MAPSDPPKTKNKSLLIGVSVLFVAVAAGGGVAIYSLRDWSAPAKARKLQNPVPATDDSIAAGKMVYTHRCASCHGEKGDGKGEKAGDLSVEPTNFTDAREMSLSTDGELFWKISEGHRPMPRFKDKLSENERWDLVNYIRTFSASPATRGNP
jgi:mono/diheme cytochrome c family protein